MSTTPVQASARLPRLIVLKAHKRSGGHGNAHYKKDNSVFLGEWSVFNTICKIEVEQSEKFPNYVSLRFCYSNKYWRLKADDRVIVATSNKPDEDIKKPSCTLFEPKVDEKGVIFTHVQSGGRVLVDESTMALYVGKPEDSKGDGYLRYVNWDSLLQLPKNVAFKGYNDSWLGGIWSLEVPYLQFSVDDPNTPITTYKIEQVYDGHIRIYSNYFNRYLRRSDIEDWIVGESSDTANTDKDTLFWPSRFGNSSAGTSSIALRNAGNNQFCICLDAHDKSRCLNAGAPNMIKAAKIVVQELVTDRKIYNVRYRMEDARIYQETPFVAGTTTAYNYADTAAGITVEVSYEDSESSSFTRGQSVTAGVTTTFEGGVPLIAEAGLEISFETGIEFSWEETKTTTKTVKATGTVPVPPKSRAVVQYVGMKGKCDVPFSYTQQDTNSTDATIRISDLIDGIYRGVNSYNFSFTIEKTQPLE